MDKETSPSPDILELRDQIMVNCHRSDALHAGSFSLCGLLIRLRDLYKWEKDLPPWVEIEPAEVISWIEEREEMWESIPDEEMLPLKWQGRLIEPFDTDRINLDLESRSWFYGGGLAAFLKPSFLLARILRIERQNGHKVIYVGEELARDLYTVPAQTKGNEIVARRRPLAAFLWETIFYGGVSRQKALALALDYHHLRPQDVKTAPETWMERFNAMLDQEIEAYVWHEIGELTDSTFPRDEWAALVGGYPHSRIELLARTLKDILADTCEDGRLKGIIGQKRLGSLSFYVAQHDGLAARLFPDIQDAFDRYLVHRDWEDIEATRDKALRGTREKAWVLLNLAREAKTRPEGWLEERVEELFYRPLGL